VLSPEPGVFAVRARTRLECETETDSVGAALRELFGELDERWTSLQLHLPSAGGTVPPVYGFIEIVRSFGEWARKHRRPLHLIAHVGHQVLLNLTSNQIGLHELLTSRLIRFWAVVNYEGGREPTRRVLYRPPRTSLKEVLMEVLGDVHESALCKWSISLSPSPRHETGPLNEQHLEQNLCDVGVVFGSVLTLSRARHQPGHKDPASHAASAGS
jgi:hypothetical protein